MLGNVDVPYLGKVLLTTSRQKPRTPSHHALHSSFPFPTNKEVVELNMSLVSRLTNPVLNQLNGFVPIGLAL